MKLVAKKDFSNVRNLGLEIARPLHPGHVHKGARFVIGGDVGVISSLAKSDQDKIRTLVNTGSAIVDVPVNQPLIEQIDKEVVIENRRAAAAKARAESHVTMQEQLARLTEAVGRLAGAAEPAAA